MKSYKIAVIEGDGIGREVVPEGIRVLEAAARCFDLSFSWKHFDWSCETTNSALSNSAVSRAVSALNEVCNVVMRDWLLVI